MLGLIFLIYISDAFDERRITLRAEFADPASDLYLEDPADRSVAEEERDCNVLWVPEQARWETIRAQNKQADIGTGTDAALEAIEVENPRHYDPSCGLGACSCSQRSFSAPGAWQLLSGAANHVLGLEEGNKRFADHVAAATRAFALCCTPEEALEYRDELAFLQAVKFALVKHTANDSS